MSCYWWWFYLRAIPQIVKDCFSLLSKLWSWSSNLYPFRDPSVYLPHLLHLLLHIINKNKNIILYWTYWLITSQVPLHPGWAELEGKNLASAGHCVNQFNVYPIKCSIIPRVQEKEVTSWGQRGPGSGEIQRCVCEAEWILILWLDTFSKFFSWRKN